jgi:hypothetical protein
MHLIRVATADWKAIEHREDRNEFSLSSRLKEMFFAQIQQI